MSERKISHYQLLERLGAGGMGEVFKARDTKLEREVALKLLPPEAVSDPDRLQRFKQEALATSALNHPNITTIYEIDQDDGQPFICIEFIAGKTLRQLLRDEKPELPQLLDLAAQTAEGLAAAHEADVVHRDLKPENIMLRSDGIVKILDFGLAKLAGRATVSNDDETVLQASPGSGTLTRPGMVMGTVAYMSPEQARGQELDHRSDVFSFGSILYEMVSGQAPFRGESSVEVMNSVIREQPHPLGEINAEIPVELQRIVRKAIAKSPDERYQNAKDMAIDLKSLKREVDSGSVSAMHAAVTPQPPGSVSSRSRAWLGWATALVIAAIAVYFGLRGSGGITPDSALALRISKITTTGEASSPVFSPDGAFLAYKTQIDNQDAIRLRQLATGSDVEVVAPKQDISLGGLSFTPDGNWLLYTSRPQTSRVQTLWRVPPLGGTAREVLQDVGGAPSFSPQGDRFIFYRFVGFRDIRFYAASYEKPEEFEEVHTAPDSALFVVHPVWSAQDEIAYVQMNMNDLTAKLMIKPLSGGEPRQLPGPRWSGINGYAWTPDGEGLYLAGARSWIERAQIWYADRTEGAIRRVTNDLDAYSDVTVRDDGNALAATRVSTTSQLWSVTIDATADVPARDTQRITRGTAVSGDPSISPDGSEILFTSDEGGEMNVWLTQIDGANRRQLTFGAQNDFSPSWSPDGTRIVFGREREGDLQIWVMDRDGQNARQLTHEGSINYAPHWSPDGEWIAFIGARGDESRLYKVLSEGGEPEILTEEAGAIVNAEWSPDGEWIASWIEPETMGAPGMELGLFATDGSGQVRNLGERTSRQWTWLSVRWTPDSSSLAAATPHEGAWNLELWPLDGSDKRRLTAFTGDEIIFSWDWVGGTAVLQRGTVSSDIVLLENVR
jgi:serine/threonine protein kinase